METVLTIAGFDPSSGAGVTADLMVFAAHGLFGTSCITGLTIQSTRGVRSTHPVEPEIVRATLQTLAEDVPAVGIKIGMLSSASAVAEVIEFLRSGGRSIPVVLDPVLRSSSGRELLEPGGVDLLREELLPLVDWVTPNLDELAVLTGFPIQSRADILAGADALTSLVATRRTQRISVLATCGHLDPPDDLLLTSGSEPVWLSGEHIASPSTHGTGCALSSALLSRIVLGDEPYAAALAAKQYVAEAIRSAIPRGSGNGPLNLLWPLEPRRLPKSHP
jgi:hydroxymethylpyrimidine/phosphomethylpyrimidine kinase